MKIILFSIFSKAGSLQLARKKSAKFLENEESKLLDRPKIAVKRKRQSTSFHMDSQNGIEMHGRVVSDEEIAEQMLTEEALLDQQQEALGGEEQILSDQEKRIVAGQEARVLENEMLQGAEVFQSQSHLRDQPVFDGEPPMIGGEEMLVGEEVIESQQVLGGEEVLGGDDMLGGEEILGGEEEMLSQQNISEEIIEAGDVEEEEVVGDIPDVAEEGEVEVGSEMEVQDFSSHGVGAMSEMKIDVQEDDTDDSDDETNSEQDVSASEEEAPAPKRPKMMQAKKISPKKRGRKPNPEKIEGKRKGRQSAYVLYCNATRDTIVKQEPNLKFSEVSKRLGLLWQNLPTHTKNIWKTKALQQQGNADTKKPSSGMIQTGKRPPVKTPPVQTEVPLRHQTIQSSMKKRTTPKTPIKIPESEYKGHRTVDCAAHLKLLGESLEIIGARLQEHQGKIAVQGSLSVLLDFMLCALAPLTCLTVQHPLLKDVNIEQFCQTLDNTAFIMPGVG